MGIVGGALLSGMVIMTVVFDEKLVLSWAMVNVSDRRQGDAHLLQLGERVILIDTGDKGSAERQLLPLLQERGIQTIDQIFISHAHRDHYGGLEALLENNIHLNTVYFQLPDRTICDLEVPWGCDYDHVNASRARLKNAGIKVQSAYSGQVIDLGSGGGQIKVLYAFDGVRTPVGKTDINDTSLIMLLSFAGQRILFAGDLNRKLGQYLAKDEAVNLQADLLKIPHHGAESLAPDRFFDASGAHTAMIPAPRELWCNDPRTERVRNWIDNNDIKTFVSGIHGHVEVRVSHEGIETHTQYKARECGRRKITSKRITGISQLKIRGNVDAMQCNGKQLKLTGWAAWQGHNDQQSLIVLGVGEIERIRIREVGRPDVVRTFDDDDLYFSGFDVDLTLVNGCPSGKARICMVSRDGNTGARFRLNNIHRADGCRHY